MKVYKRNGQEVDFCLDKIKDAIGKANESTFHKFFGEIENIYAKDPDFDPDTGFSYDDVMHITDDGYDWSLDRSDDPYAIWLPKTIGKEKFVKEISKYILVDGTLDKVIETTQKFLKPFDTATVEDISDVVERALMKCNSYEVAKEYITYRNNKQKKKKFTDTEEKCLSVIDGTNEELRGDNANKRIDVNSSARDYIAGTVCKSIAEKILPPDVLKAHKKKYIHFHDMDYSPVMHEHNCCVFDMEDMLDNGFCMNDVGIKSPKRFSTAANLCAQANLIISSLEYGGQSFSWTGLAKYVDTTRLDIAIKYALNLLKIDDNKLDLSFCKNVDDVYKEYKKRTSLFKRMSKKDFIDFVERETKHDIHIGVKTYQFQVLCHQSSQGQTPFVSNVLCLREAESEHEQKDLAFIIEEILKRRIKGVTDKNGLRMAPLFPKLLYYVSDGLNKNPEDPYYYLTKLAAKCMATSMQPDIISEKKNREAKHGQIVPAMGCRSFLQGIWIEKTYPIDTKFHWQEIDNTNVQYDGAPGKNFNYAKGFGTYSELPFKNNIVINFRGNSGWVKTFNHENKTVTIIQPKVYGRFNGGVVTLVLPHAALTARKNVNEKYGLEVAAYKQEYLQEYKDEFYKVLNERLELCHKGLLARWELSIKKIKAKNSPLLWQYGALARLPEDASIGDWIMSHEPDFTSFSLGYVGLYETCRAILNDTNTSKDGQDFSIEVLQFMNNTMKKWKETDKLGYSIYGTPEESLTDSASRALKRDFGEITGITDHNYVTNSYHVNPAEKITAWDKLKIEGQYLQLSPGGAVSYIEVPDMKKNTEALEEVIRYIADNIMYAEVNTKIDTCYKCNYEGEMKMIKSDSGKFKFECPNCGNKDDNLMRVTRRICGYMGVVSSGNTNVGRLADIYDRVLHLDND